MCKCSEGFVYVLVLISSLLCFVNSFNLETINFVRHEGDEQSMFGFSVSTHKEQGRSWIIVGAPTAQEEKSRIHRGGVVYKCSVFNESRCEEIHFPQDSDRGKALDDKNNQWFGATISSAGPDGPVVACAPRYVWFTTSREERRDPVGTCYIAKDNFRSFSEYSPCRTSLFGYHRQGSCQAGFSAGISKDGRRLFVGAPGSWYWQGQTYSIDPSIKFPYTPGIFGEAFGFGTKGQAIQQSLDDRPAVMSTPEGPAEDDDSYMGYSMVVGDFNGEGVQGVAVGMPKAGKMLEGRVLIYTWSMTNYLNLTGTQFGSYFGYSLATADVDGDHRDDLIIGAPLHVEKNTESKYEVGRVYVAYQGRNGAFKQGITLDGYNSKSRFGLSVCGLGDLNLDSYGDFAVGAPYDGENERGAVYIFQGSANGVITKYSQVIYAEDVQNSFGQFYPLSTFGFSLSGGLDLDGNDYPDVAVGAYLTNNVYFFRSRPVVKVEAKLQFLSNPKQVYLEQKNCVKPGDPTQLVSCTTVELCMKYTGVGTPAQIEMNLEYTLDSKLPGYSRMYIKQHKMKVFNRTLTLYKDTLMNCQYTDTIYLEEKILDKLTELEIEVKYSLERSIYYKSPARDPHSILEPIVDLSTPAVINQTISIYKNCGEDNICIPNLFLAVDTKVDKYYYKVGNPLQFQVAVINSGENAYNTKLFLHLPQGVAFKVATEVGKVNPISCKSNDNKTIYWCDMGNPLTRDNPMQLNLEVEPLKKQKILKPTYDFYFNVTSANPGYPKDLINATRRISVDIRVDTTLLIESKATPSTVYYNVTKQTNVKDNDNLLRPQVIHSYTVTNKGSTEVEDVELLIVWPLKTLSGEDLLYLLEQPHTLGGAQCEWVRNVNPYNLESSSLRDIWSTVGINKDAFLSNSTQETLVVNKTIIPGEKGDTKTQTITTVTFYENPNKIVHQYTYIGEPGLDDFWGNISAITSEFREPLTIKTNSSTLVTRYMQGVKLNEKIVPFSPNEEPLHTYNTNTDQTTVITYYGPNNNVIHTETTKEQPGSIGYRSQIKNTKQGLLGVVGVNTTTTKTVTITTTKGKVLHQEVLLQTGTDETTNPEISRESVVTYVTFFGPNNKELHKEALTVNPSSSLYWEQINKIISNYNTPVTVHTSSSKVVIYYENGLEVRREEKPLSGVAVEAAFTSHTEVNTVITITDTSGNVLFRDTIIGDNYNDRLVNIIKNFREPVIVNTKTTHVITYKRLDGRVVKVGTYIEERTESFLPNQLETTSTSTITTVTIYDKNKNVLHRENITDVDSEASWKNIHKLIASLNQPIVIQKQVITFVTYYFNGKPVRTEPDFNKPHPDTTLTAQTEIQTVVTVINSNGNVLYNKTVFDKVSDNYIKDLVETFPEAITLHVRTTHVIKYVDPEGHVEQIGTYIQERTEKHHSRTPTTTTVTVTVVTLTDLHGNVLLQQNITEMPGSDKYWNKVNKLISLYQEPVTLTYVIHKYAVYYVDGKEVKVPGEDTGNPAPSILSTHSETTTEIIARSLDGRIIYHDTVPGRVGTEQIAGIVEKLRESSIVTIKTVKKITYRSSDGRIINTGREIEERTETHNKSSNETHTSSTITTVTFYDISGNILHQENVTETPESKAYWEKITRLISSYRQPVEIRKKTQTIRTYYINGYISRTEVVDDGVASETQLATQSDIATIIEVYDLSSRRLYQDTLYRPATSEDVSNVVNRFRESVRIKIQTTYTITYKNRQGQVVQIGTYVETRTENHAHHTNETSSTSTITTVIFYDLNRNILHQEEIRDEPDTRAYWEKINQVISRYREVITLHITTKKVITYYVNGQPVRTKDVPSETPPTTCGSHTETKSHVTVYNNNQNALYQETIPGEKGTIAFNTAFNNILRRYHEPIVVKIKTTYTITYRGLDGRVIHTGEIKKEETEKHNQNQQETKRVTTITTITYHGSSQNILHRETISDEPGTPVYWDHIKTTIIRLNVPVNIYTNSSKLVTYYVNGQEVRHETLDANAGIFEAPFTAHVDIKNVIVYYDSSKNELFRENIDGLLSPQDRQDRIAEFSKRYSRTFTIETNTTKTITFRSSTGQVLNVFSLPVTLPTNPLDRLSRTVTQTTFIVYGPDRRTIVYNETIEGEPGSNGYNDVVAKIIHRFTGPITIYTNSTKTITYYNNEGHVLDHQFVPEPRSTIEKDTGSVAANARTTITFYGPDGQALHSDTIAGAPGPDLQEQLRQVASRYGGVVKSYGGVANGGSIGSSVPIVDTPYPGNKPSTHQSHVTDFTSDYSSLSRSQRNQSNSWNPRDNSYGLQDLSNEDLASFARGKGFRTGGLELGASSSGSVDRHIDTHARNSFDTHTSYDGSHNYLSSQNHNLIHGRRKREDNTDEAIKTLTDCKTSSCIIIRCATGPIQVGDEVHIAMKSRVFIETLKNISMTQPVNIQSLLLARINQIHEISGPPADRKVFYETAKTVIMAPQPELKPDIVPLWVVVLSAVAGTLILLLLIFLLYMCGFFNRNRPSDAPERQPLNRNGHYQHGDEAL